MHPTYSGIRDRRRAHHPLATGLVLGSVLVFSLGCSDTQISSTDRAPVVEWLRPIDGTNFHPIEPLELCAQISDEAGLDGVELTLTSSVDGVLEVAADECEGGNWGAWLLLSDSDHTLTLAAVDPRGQVDTASTQILASDNTVPECALLSPEPEASIELGQSWEVEASVQDAETASTELTVTVESDLDGLLWEDSVPSDGSILFSWQPAAAGDHWIWLRVEDPRGLAAECAQAVFVDPCLDEDLDGQTTCDGDCDDLDASSHLGGEEVADGADNDCDGTIDEGTVLFDDDEDGWTEVDGDCDDEDASIYPEAEEVAYDGIDQDCDGGDSIDLDGDGYAGDSGPDCDDEDATIYPGAAETWYDGVDSDCDGGSDYDADGDGFDSDEYLGDDCDDADNAINPSEAEIWYDGIDSDCDGGSDYDADGDGDDAGDYGGGDCDDSDATVSSLATESRDGLDNDCDNSCDEGLISTGDLIVSEFMKDPTEVSDDDGEWFEVYNTTLTDITICASWVFEDDDGDSFSLAGGYTVHVPAESYAVLGRSVDTAVNGGATVDYGYATGFRLANGADEIVLIHDGIEIDRVEYDDGASWPDASGYSVSLDPSSHDDILNDDGENWCEGASTYGLGDLGTPGTANDGC